MVTVTQPQMAEGGIRGLDFTLIIANVKNRGSSRHSCHLCTDLQPGGSDEFGSLCGSVQAPPPHPHPRVSHCTKYFPLK